MHSFANSDRDPFSDAFWMHFFESGAPPVAMLDIGTGNGAIPMVASRVLGARVRIVGIDTAVVKPDSVKCPELERVQFLSETSCESLPFADESFDMVTSQFAIEYTDMDASLDEVLRVRRPSARVAFVMHADDSHIGNVSKAQIEQIDWLLGPGGFHDAAQRMIKVLEARNDAKSTGVLDPELVRHQYNASARALVQKIEQAGMGDALARSAVVVQRLLAAAAKGQRNDGTALLGDASAAFRGEAQRLRAQLIASLSLPQVAEIAGRLRYAGLQVKVGELHYQGSLMAHTLVATP